MNHPTYFAIITVPKFASTSSLPCRFAFTAILISWLAILPMARAVTPAPDGGYPGGNTAEGEDALFSIPPSGGGGGNTAMGQDALFDNTTGNANTAIGADALIANESGSNNTAIGAAALNINKTASNNTATGANALLNNTSGEDNTAAGSSALQGNTTGNDNTATGFEVLLKNTSGTANTASGLHAMQFNTIGSDNTASGLIALQSNTTGAENTALGAFALATSTTGKNNTAEGSGALANSTTGSNNVAVGFDAGLNLKSGNNNIDIGANVVGSSGDANTIRIGKQGTQKSTFVAGIFGTAVTGSTVVVNSTGKLGIATSSARFKEQIKPMNCASEAILKLKPVSFRYKQEVDPDGITQFGLVAEEVEKVNPDLVVRDEEGKVMTVRYEAVNAMLLNEFLKEHRKVQEQALKQQELEATIVQQQKDFQGSVSKLKATVATLTATMKEQASLIQNVSDQIEASKAAPQLVAENQ